jgi:hypothetical protein
MSSAPFSAANLVARFSARADSSLKSISTNIFSTFRMISSCSLHQSSVLAFEKSFLGNDSLFVPALMKLL